MEYQNRHNSRIGEVAVERGLATPFEVERIRALQTKEDLLFGEAAIRLRILSGEQVYEMLCAQKDAHLELGQALIDQGFMDREAVDEAAAAFINLENSLQPEVFTLPEELPSKELVVEVFYLAHKLLLRACNLVSKPDVARVADDFVPLSDRNVSVRLGGALEGSLVLGVPHAISLESARAFSGEEVPDEDAQNAIVHEMAQILADNLSSALAERGRRLSVGEPTRIGQRLVVPAGMRTALVPFVTHRGQVLVAVTLPAGS